MGAMSSKSAAEASVPEVLASTLPRDDGEREALVAGLAVIHRGALQFLQGWVDRRNATSAAANLKIRIAALRYINTLQ